MTTKTIKTILFASLMVAMILPFSAMSMADAAPNENAKKRSAEIKGQLFIKDSRDIGGVFSEYNQLNKVLNDETTSQSAKDNAVTRMQEIREQPTPELMPTEKRDTIRGQIDSTSAVIEQLEKAGVPVVLIGTDHENQSLRIGVDREGLTNDKLYVVEERIRSVIGNDIDLTIELSDETILLGCNQQGDCEPVQGGVKVTPFGYTSCSVGYRATFNSEEGFITAGHCTSGNTGVDVGNPTGWWWDKVGEVTHNSFAAYTWCDCAFVKATDESISSKIFDNITLSGTKFPDMYSWIHQEGFVTQGAIGGITDNYVVKQIEGVWVYGIVETTAYAIGGDSGGTVYEETWGSGTPKFMGIITAGPSNGGSPSYYTPYYSIENEFSGITFG